MCGSTRSAVSAGDPRNVWFAGSAPLAARFDGETIREVPVPRALWSRYDTSVDEVPWLRAVKAFAPRDVWAAGDFGIVHYDGACQRPSAVATVSALDGVGPDDLWAVGGWSRPVVAHRHC